MKFNNETQAIQLLKDNDVFVSSDFDIMFPRKAQFIDEVHEAIEYLIDEWDFDIKYI